MAGSLRSRAARNPAPSTQMTAPAAATDITSSTPAIVLAWRVVKDGAVVSMARGCPNTAGKAMRSRDGGKVSRHLVIGCSGAGRAGGGTVAAPDALRTKELVMSVATLAADAATVRTAPVHRPRTARAVTA